MRAISHGFFLFIAIVLAASLAVAESPAPIGKRLARVLPGMAAGQTAVVIVYLKDKGPAVRLSAFSPSALLSERAIARRSKVPGNGGALSEQDIPVYPDYVAEIAGIATRTRHALRWFNAVSVEATTAQIEALRRLSAVREIDLVGRWRGTPEPELSPSKDAPDELSGTQAHLLDYGSSLTQNEQIGVANVHDLGIFGEGVVVGVFDNGFRLLTHQAFDSMDIIAQYDFVDHKVSVVPDNPSTGFGSHGVWTLSTVGGYKPGQVIGPAFRSRFVLARTENDSSETPVEEDNWAAAIEWADSIGIDVASTSLGYVTYDPPYTSWTWVDMDGNTTLITKAADHAVSLGIVVVNSAGNSGPGNGTDNTLVAPSDGDSVIAAGAVTADGSRASFSSVGPTTDVPARIKPDVMAMGVSVRVASSTNPSLYTLVNGTSFSCPLTAGVAALILSANPNLTPMQVRDAMRNTADNAASPNNQYGWGILDADSAIATVGIVPMATLAGTLYEDLNGNGARDGGEPAIPGTAVYLSGTSPDTALTGAGGEFLFDGLAPGADTLSTVVPAGWMVTTTPAALSTTVFHRDTLTGFDIGLYEPGAASGTVFEDLNSNGVRDSAEAGLEGWSVILSGGAMADTVVTDSSGGYSFTGILAGDYTISEIPQPQWLQSTPPSYGAHALTVASGFDTTTLDFGDFLGGAGVYQVGLGWNLLSLPVEVLHPLADSIYPNAVTSVSVYDSGYQNIDTLVNGRGYWVKFPATQNILIMGLDRTVDSVDVVPGWNLIGGLSAPVQVSTIVEEPPGIVTSNYFGFQNNAYTGLAIDASLIPHTGYWVKCSAAGILILDSGPPSEAVTGR